MADLPSFIFRVWCESSYRKVPGSNTVADPLGREFARSPLNVPTAAKETLGDPSMLPHLGSLKFIEARVFLSEGSPIGNGDSVGGGHKKAALLTKSRSLRREPSDAASGLRSEFPAGAENSPVSGRCYLSVDSSES